VAEQMHPPQPERFANGRQFVDEAIRAPQGGVRRALRPSGAELVVHHDRALLREIAEDRKAAASSARSAMQQQERRSCRRRTRPHDPVIDLAARNRDESLSGGQTALAASLREHQRNH
jgi:hypothetical protein